VRWRFPLGLGLLWVFVAMMAVLGLTQVDDGTPRIVHVADGRTVDIGPSWPGALDECVTDPTLDELPNCYREDVVRDSFVKQPYSTGSTAVFCLVGLLILWIADRERARPHARLTTREQTWAGFVALAMGPGSALFHGTLTIWGGWFDQLSMYALLSFILATDAVRVSRRTLPYWVWFWVPFAFSGVLKGVSGDAGTYVFIAVAVAIGVFALVSWLRLLARAGVRRSGRRLLLAYALLFSAIMPWLASNPSAGAPTDVPYHLAWHVLSALFVGAYWWYLRSETPLAAGGADGQGSSSPASRSSAAEKERTAIALTSS
jgi:hypothetical protein